MRGNLAASRVRRHALLVTITLFCSDAAAQGLKQVARIDLPDVQGRIDHMSIDTKDQRLFVAALGYNTVEVVDLRTGKRTTTITGTAEPQGVLYVASEDRLYVASGKDGTVKVFDGTSFKLLQTVDFGDDADNLRYDASREYVYVGYGSGALGELDRNAQKGPEVKLGSHPESFQLEKNRPRIYVNLPKSRIAVVNRETHSIATTWGTGLALANYAMALDEGDHRLFVVTRFPARLLVFDTESGKTVQKLSAVGDCDDIFYDQARKRLYATGGEGAISVFEQQDPDRYKEIARIPTSKGARTSFFSAELGRLYVGVRRQGSTPAMIQVFETQ